MPITQLVHEECINILGPLSIVGSSDGLFAFVGTSFELVTEICINNKNNYQYWYRKNLQSTKNAGTTKEILIIRQMSIVPLE